MGKKQLLAIEEFIRMFLKQITESDESNEDYLNKTGKEFSKLIIESFSELLKTWNTHPSLKKTLGVEFFDNVFSQMFEIFNNDSEGERKDSSDQNSFEEIKCCEICGEGFVVKNNDSEFAYDMHSLISAEHIKLMESHEYMEVDDSSITVRSYHRNSSHEVKCCEICGEEFVVVNNNLKSTYAIHSANSFAHIEMMKVLENIKFGGNSNAEPSYEKIDTSKVEKDLGVSQNIIIYKNGKTYCSFCNIYRIFNQSSGDKPKNSVCQDARYRITCEHFIRLLLKKITIYKKNEIYVQGTDKELSSIIIDSFSELFKMWSTNPSLKITLKTELFYNVFSQMFDTFNYGSEGERKDNNVGQNSSHKITVCCELCDEEFVVENNDLESAYAVHSVISTEHVEIMKVFEKMGKIEANDSSRAELGNEKIELPIITMDLPVSENVQIRNIVVYANRKRLCRFCNINVTDSNAFLMHLNGKKHRKVLQAPFTFLTLKDGVYSCSLCSTTFSWLVTKPTTHANTRHHKNALIDFEGRCNTIAKQEVQKRNTIAEQKIQKVKVLEQKSAFARLGLIHLQNNTTNFND